MALTDNLEHYWKGEDAVDTIAGLNLTANGTVTYTGGLIGNAATVVTAGYLDVATQPITYAAAGTAFSTNGWIKFTATPASEQHMTLWFRSTDGTRIRQFSSAYDKSAGAWIFSAFPNASSATTTMSYTAAVSNDTWYMFTTVYDGTNLNMYLNGSAVGTPLAWTKGTYNTNAQHTYIFQQSNTANKQIDEVGIWSRALSSTEVAALYNDGLGTQYPFSEMKSGKVVVVGGGASGGGSGAGNVGGGGGAGQKIYNSAYPLSAQAYSVTIGNGGNAVTTNVVGNNGQSSVFSTLTAIGGGGGGANSGGGAQNGVAGGSGGGAGPGATGGASTGGVGFAGGNGGGAAAYGGGGGGGTSAVGSAGTGSTGGQGGAGTADANIGGLLAMSGLGVSGVIGGGGGGTSLQTNGPAGTGGGGAGGANATANTGSGGGGGNAGGTGSGTASGAGGSGVVIVSVPTADFTVSSTGTLNTDYKTGTSGSETWIAFLTSQTLTLGTPSTANTTNFFHFF